MSEEAANLPGADAPDSFWGDPPFSAEAAGQFEPMLPPWYKAAVSIEELEEKHWDEIVDAAFALLGEKFPRYQQRGDQIAMAKMCLRAMMASDSAVVEAGTGIGKSFAYLISSIAFSYLSGERVLISTETRNLQIQLFEKDLPFLADVLTPESPLSYSLCLGSGNYLCRLRYNDSLDQGRFRDLISEDALKPFREWAARTFEGNGFGSGFEYGENISGHFWSTVNRDSDGCPGARCQFFSSCNYFRARNEWMNSRLLVGNHHLLLFHNLNEKRTLPPYGVVILDEAHGFIATGYNIFTLSFSREAMSDQKKIYDRTVKKLMTMGPEQEQEMNELWAALQQHWDVFFSQWEVACDLSFDTDRTEIISRAHPVDASQAKAVMEELSNRLADLGEAEEDAAALNQLKMNVKFFQRTGKFLEHYSAMNLEKFVYWGRKDAGVFTLNSCSLDLGKELAELLIEPQVWTSATLGYWPFPFPPRSRQEMYEKGYFQGFLREAMPETKKMKEAVFFSPFNYREQAMLYVPAHLETPAWEDDDAVKERHFQDQLAEIEKLIQLSSGSALVLFTSRYQLEKTGEELKENLPYNVYSQADFGAAGALERFREDPGSVLLGTSSFWQGVDVPGDNLKMLIITKMMFTPPDDPIYKARSQQLEKKNRKPFFDLALPQASIMLRQAFGRLIRSETDKGVVAILDHRLLVKSYGKNLLSNLPPVRLGTTEAQLREFTGRLGWK